MPSSAGSSRSEGAAAGPVNGAQTTDEPRPPADEEVVRRGEEAAGDNTDARRQSDHDAELARLEDRYKRVLADLDNYRKRSARELDRRVQEARDAFLREWLEAVDSVERALRMDAGGPLAEGMRAVLDQMEAILARHGVQRIGAAGEPFDPERHEAVAVRTTEEVPDRTVVEVIRAGYAVEDRVLRPAQVAVARRPQTGS